LKPLKVLYSKTWSLTSDSIKIKKWSKFFSRLSPKIRIIKNCHHSNGKPLILIQKQGS